MTPAQLQQIVAEAEKALDGDQPWIAVELYTNILTQTDPKTDQAEEKELRLTALYERGRVLERLGEKEAAISAYEQYLNEASDDRHRVRAIEATASILRRLGRYPEARAKYEESLKLAESIMYPYGRAKSLEGLGIYHHILGHNEEAKNYFQMAYTLFKSSGHVPGQITTLIAMGLMYSYNEIDKAIATYNEALSLARNLGQIDQIVTILNNLGENYQDLFAMEQALSIHQEALSLAQQGRLRAVQADLHRNIGVELIYLDRLDEAMSNLTLALQISRENHNVDFESQALYSLAIAEARQNNAAAAAQYAQQLYELADSNDNDRYRARARYALGLARQKLEDYNAAAEQWQQALFLAHQTDQQMLLWQIHTALAENSPIPGLGAVHLRIAAEIIQQIAHPIKDETLRQKFLTAPIVADVLARAR
ncbi:MAG: tetratricopeptide repeat protein [Anaerolineae bacterium]|nr:tetratricopeptide repeat protein [Anaerolineae bacterium]